MAQAGLHAYIAFLFKKKLPFKKWFFISFLIGSIIPDIDLILVPIGLLASLGIEDSILLLHRTFSHSIITLIIIYLSFLIIYEIKKDINLLFICNGFCLGILLHILIDIFLWFEPIHILWPLPIDEINFFNYIEISYFFKIFLLSSEFFLFRVLAWKLIKIIITNPLKNADAINSLSKFMKVELVYLILFIISSIYLDYSYIYYIFGIFYIPSLIFMILMLYRIKDSINLYALENKDEPRYIKNKSSITNIE